MEGPGRDGPVGLIARVEQIQKILERTSCASCVAKLMPLPDSVPAA
jgi:hypothetical protein